MKARQKFFYLAALVALVGLLWPATLSAQAEVTCELDYTVQAGDFLSKIAADTLGDSKLYPAIIAATNAKAATDNSYHAIGQNNIIQPGWKLCIPAATAPEQPEATTPTAANPGPLTVDALANATYSGIYDEPITLSEGRYEGEPFVGGDPSRPMVEYLNSSELYGDLNGDGVEDAAVFLVENSGGTGNFVYVAAQLNQNGQPVDAGAVWIEDRIQIISAVIENGQIKLEITAEGPGDAACCKSHKTTKTYALQDGQLAEIPGEETALERISTADLNGTTWTLLELDVDQPALPDTAVTLSFTEDQLSGSGGCNNYSGSFSLGTDNPFVMTIGPLVSTQMACPEPILNQETSYLSALQSVTQWGYVVGNLAIYYDKGDGALGRLLFTPSTAAVSSQFDRLTGATWQWVRLTDPVQQVEIDQPENFTLTFMPDGTIQIQADCNQATASYTAAEDGALSITPGITTLTACSPGSRGEEFVQKLGFAARYFFQDGNLFIDMMADGGTLEFSPQ
jgi:heat shock protein HslJ